MTTKRPAATQADKRADDRYAAWWDHHHADELDSQAASASAAILWHRPYVNQRLRARLAELAGQSPRHPAALYYDAFKTVGPGTERLFVDAKGDWVREADSAVWMTEAQAQDLRHNFPSLDYAKIFVFQPTGELIPW
jgi:hypothetical protein